MTAESSASIERSPPPRDFELRPDALQAWLESFPATAKAESTRAIVKYLATLNRSDVALEKRVHLLETLSARTLPLLRDLAVTYGKSTQPLSNQAREALRFARSAALAMASGYRIAAFEKASTTAAPGKGIRRAPLVLKAMRFMAEALRASYRTYSRVPEGAWRELHGLYLFAEREGLATGPADAGSGISVTEFYCGALLLSLTDPYRLVRGELEEIEALIVEMHAAVTVGREAPETRPTSHFVVPCGEDAPPKPLRDASRDEPSGARVFDASAIVYKLKARREEADGYGRRNAQAPLIDKLVGLWDDPPRRAFQRDPAQGSVAICVGVKPIAHFVAHDATADGEAETRALREGITMPLRALPEDESGQAIPIHEWAVINLSAGGVRVRRSASTAYPITVGEIVGIRAPGKDLWTVGVTRWITGLDDGTTEFGVQFFANAICAVWVKDAAPTSARKLGLLVAEGDDNADESLLAPPNTYSSEGEFELRGEGFRSRVRASTLVEKTAHFELFHVVPS
jgi:cyclic-di-GMP-binding protein